jgi:hypothetical protein
LASPTILGAGSAWIGEPPGSGMDMDRDGTCGGKI